MASSLYRLGRLAFRRRWYVAGLWFLVLVGLGAASAQAPEAPDTAFSAPGIEAQRAFDLMDERFPGAQANGATARVVFVAPKGEKVTSARNRAAIDQAVTRAAAGQQVASAVGPFTAGAVSEDGSTAYATVTYAVAAADLTDAAKDTLRGAAQGARDAGLTVETGGTALADSPGPGGAGEVIGIVVAAVVLLVTFGSLAAAGLPLLTAVLGVGVSMTAITTLADPLGLTSTSSTLASMLGLACGIDYALFVLSRYREERANGHTEQDAAGLAVGTAGSAVVFAGLTVVIALAGLSVVGIPMLTKMGLCAAGAVVLAVLVCLTMTPALIGFWPRAVLSRRYRLTGRRVQGVFGNRGSRWAEFVQRHPFPVRFTAMCSLIVLAIPVLSLQLGMPGDEVKSTATSERRAYDDLARGFGPGFNGPLTIVVDARKAGDAKAAVTTIENRVKGTKGVVSVTEPRFDQAGDTAVFSAVSAWSPTDRKTEDLVHTIRDHRTRTVAGTGATFEVTGTTALNIDVAQKVQRALIPYLVVVVGLAVVLLLMVFRSVFIPLKAAVGFLLSVLAALGCVVAVFQWGWGASLLGVESTGPIMSMMPIFLVGIVFGLAMDYEVFLVSRIREAYVHGQGAGESITTGFRYSARVVAAAALIMISVFAGFVTADESMIKMIGFGLAVAVLFDAFVVRMAFVPGVLALLGDKVAWLPKWLDRLLPHLDVEGEALSRAHPAPTPQAGTGQPG
ncbi:MMPL family transporter [Streptomyces niveiscabiei]|uniref:MMPL family transporter n=1 Tax=Streptomyces niveiscabiei TaxID=164115 RepID=UPI0029A750D0|nr:MMPL family transporter [Streptomyces niveiscabiei]MDX3382410.1 MMPL family transporter [Streptomyces niveiscabiei]